MTTVQLFLYIILPLLTLSGVGVLAFFTLKYWREQKSQANNIHWQQVQVEKAKGTLSLRLQAYERLTLLCERISLPNLIKRLRTEGASANDLRMAMLIGIHQEFEHNITQQIYVGENLWTILKVARDNTAEIINIAASKLDDKADSSALVNEIFAILEAQKGDSLAKAQAAIRQEAASLMS